MSEPHVELKAIKHVFPSSERLEIGDGLSQALCSLRGIESEFDQIKATYKAKLAEAAARIELLSTNLANGFEYRTERCVVYFNYADRKRYYHLADLWEAGETSSAVLVEPMSAADLQQQLL